MMQKVKVYAFSTICTFLAAIATLNVEPFSIFMYYQPDIPKCLKD